MTEGTMRTKILDYVSNEIVGKHVVELGDSILVTKILVEMGKLDLETKPYTCFPEATGGFEVDKETKRITKIGVLATPANDEASSKKLPYDLIHRLTILIDKPVES
mmetsp:Transcript_2222/g.4673  ORF Transcript_2222/g.4673 Transcript_2222/m.4673 type:complete len:106 (-) Transcript_2222:138-455(-)|eukprot:CAMPEP_0168276162 /NCGR_PEP_ID=MMETSP0141_2-20121125/18367_1 /TAXON_ID=44445 /ORGANISM="Pseudo-nitzschia australis, Strain 10249 10 AB" /LENGTH=105 /DNA_ID=CAMNT_0008218163 /DNA_START=201 /DNA_END=518 /DNA_ORIENTATION=-